MPYDVLVIDDEADIRDLICDVLKDENYTTRQAIDSLSAFNMINEKLPSVVILDIWLQGSELDGLGILEIINKKHPNLPVIMISGHGTIETAVSSIKIGAYDYIEKPFTQDKLLVTVRRACEMAKLVKENAELKARTYDKKELIGNSHNLSHLRSTVEKVAPTSSRVLIYGPPSTGKEILARLIHSKSKRNHEQFVVLNAAGISQERAQVELFGEESTAGHPINDKPRRPGMLEIANNGTLFIKEVGELPIPIQNKLLRFLQDQTFERQNGNKAMKLDVRVIASTSVDLEEEVKAGRFRQELYYRLNVVPMKVASLSERREDIPLLCHYFINQLAERDGLQTKIISEDAIATMQAYKWPGNVRQLRNVIEWLMIMSHGVEGDVIRADILPPDILSSGIPIARNDMGFDMMSMPLREAREVFERQYLVAQMNRFNGNISRTSAFIGMERSALHRKLKSLNIYAANINSEETDDVKVG
jgi:two-component system nitrogen regulation response regulator NtrX